LRSLAWLVASLIMLVGVVGVFAPDRLIALGRYVSSPAGLYSIAALRVAIGLVLLLVAPISRAPKPLRVLGAFVVVAGLATPLFGVERTRAILDWESTQGTALVRAGGALALVLGASIGFAVVPRSRPV
jgi:hypothetical protein